MPEPKIITIFDALTGKTVEQELTENEIAEREALQAELEAQVQARENAKASAVSKLAALGLTESEIAAL